MKGPSITAYTVRMAIPAFLPTSADEMRARGWTQADIVFVSGDAYVDHPIMTGLGYARNAIVVKTGRAVIAIDGAYGTLSEIGHALGDGTPVIGLETWDLPERDDLALHIEVADSPADAVRRAIAAAHERDAPRPAKAR